MQPRQRILLEWSLVTLLVCVLVALCAGGGWLWRSDLQLHDMALSRHAGQPDPGIVIIAIDDDSLNELGRWPWPRSTHAALLDRLTEAGAGPVAMDVIFSEPSPNDPALAAAMRRNGHVVLPVLQQSHHGQITSEDPPNPALISAAAALGHIQAEFDPDGVVRSVYLFEGWQRPAYPQLALALYGLSRGEVITPPANIHGKGWQRADWLRIPFVGPPGSFTQYSYADVLNGRVPDSALRNKLILVGATAVGMADSVPVPFSGLSGPMPGVEVHANVLTALRNGTAIHLMPRWLNALLSVSICFLLMCLLARVDARAGLIWTGVVLLGTVLLCVLALGVPDLWFAPSAAIFGCLTGYPLWSWRRLEATQRFVDAELKTLAREHVLPAPQGLDPLQQQLTMLRAAAEMSREAHRLVEAVIADLPVGVVALFADGSVRVHNRAALSLLAAGDAAALAPALRALPWPGSLPTREGLPLAPAAGQEIELRANSGRPLLVSLAPLGEGGLVLGIADLTSIEAAQQAREDTLRFVTHDLRAPLASVISLIDVAPKDIDLLGRIRGISESALGLIDEMSRLSRAEASYPKDYALCDLIVVVGESVELCWAQARSAQVKIDDRSIEQPEALVRGNADLLHRAVANLISNAIKYGGPRLTVEIDLQPEDGFWRLSVRDHGPGIPPEERGGLFQRFSRLPGAIKRGLPGTGLGLLMVRTVAERHGGRVEADFPADGGCRFSLLLPAASDDDEGASAGTPATQSA